MNILKRMKRDLATQKFINGYQKTDKKGKIRPFDDEFLASLEGKYWQGLPLYYHLIKSMSDGRCYDASTALCLAMGEGSYIVQGDLKSQEGLWNGHTGHGWVECDDKVYDTTWQIICKKDDYYKLFKPKLWSKRDYKTFKEGLKSITDPEIRTKEWYEKNPSTANILIYQVRALEMLKLKNENLTKEARINAQKVLNDLPNATLEDFNKFMKEQLKMQESEM